MGSTATAHVTGQRGSNEGHVRLTQYICVGQNVKVVGKGATYL